MRRDNPLRTIQGFGQSVWLDFIRRRMLLEGELQQMIAQDGLRGVTSNPTIFEQVITHSGDYDEDIRLISRQGRSVEDIYNALTIKDIVMAADMFRPTYERSDGLHGFVSLEINPHLAYDEDGTMEEAHRLWQAVDRPNLMLKVPATDAGLSCVRQLTREGINVNVTLIFSLSRYRQAADAYIEGLQARAADNKPVNWIASVAGFFVSRIDVMVDDILDHREDLPDAPVRIGEVYGQAGIASAKLAYQRYQEIFRSAPFGDLNAMGAQPQRLLWVTGAKSTPVSDIKYVEALIGPDTVISMPLEALHAYRDHGHPAERLTESMDAAQHVWDGLQGLDINIDRVTRSLEEQGVETSIQSYDKLMQTLEYARSEAL